MKNPTNIKRLTAIILCLMMALTTCVAMAADADGAETAIAQRKASGNMPTVVLAYPTWTGRPVGQDRIQARLSAITEEKLGIKLVIEVLDYGSWTQSMTLMLSSGEQVDIFNTLGLGYSTCVSRGYVQELDELLENYGQGILINMLKKHDSKSF